jgi:hypothetical protein
MMHSLDDDIPRGIILAAYKIMAGVVVVHGRIT